MAIRKDNIYLMKAHHVMGANLLIFWYFNFLIVEGKDYKFSSNLFNGRFPWENLIFLQCSKGFLMSE